MWENLKHNILHDVPIYIREIHKTSDANTDHRVTPNSVVKNSMTSDATLLKKRQTSVLSYNLDTVKSITQEPVINNSMTLEESHLKTNQSSVTCYDVDTVHLDSVIKNPLTSDAILHKIITCKER